MNLQFNKFIYGLKIQQMYLFTNWHFNKFMSLQFNKKNTNT